MFSEIKNYIENSNNIIIFPHKNADGDCLGSSYALKLALEKMGKNAYVMEEKEDNNRLLKVIYTYENVPLKADLAISVDCGDEDRLGTRRDVYFSYDKKINIDHHGTNSFYGDVNYVDSKAAATGEIIFNLINYLDIEINREIACNLYVALISDTGGFAYSNTTPDTMNIGAKLLEYDINHNEIYAYLFDTNTLSALRLMASALNSLTVYGDGKIAVVSVTNEDIENAGATLDEAGMLVNLPRTLDTAEVAVSLREVDEGTKVSFRSKNTDVSKVAVKFGGGGHMKAAACVMNCSLKEAEETLVKELLKDM